MNKYNNKNNKNIYNYKPKSECEKKAIKKILEYQNKYNYCECFQNNIGITGPTNPISATGSTGPQGETVGVSNFADFYALMPLDNAATVTPETDVIFPQDGPNSGAGISRTGPNNFNLADIGTYQILSQVRVNEAGQLVLTLNNNELAYTVVDKATETSQIIGMAIITTTSINSIQTVRNLKNNAVAITITPNAGGTEQVSAHLVITQIQ